MFSFYKLLRAFLTKVSNVLTFPPIKTIGIDQLDIFNCLIFEDLLETAIKLFGDAYGYASQIAFYLCQV